MADDFKAELDDLVDQIVVEAILADFRLAPASSWTPVGGGDGKPPTGVRVTWSAWTASYTLNYDHTIPWDGNSVECATSDCDDNVHEQLLESFNGVKDKWENDIPNLFDTWTELPDPEGLRPLADSAGRAMAKLQTDSALTGGDVSSNDFWNQYSLLAADLESWKGPAFNAFRYQYLNNVKTKTGAQYLAASVVTGCIEGEIKVLRNARRDVLDFAQASRDSLKTITKGSGSGGTEFAIGLALALVGIIGAAPSGGASVALSAAASGLGLATSLPQDGQAEGSGSVSGDTPDEVYDSMGDGLEAINKEMKTQETTLAELATALSTDLADDRGTYDLGVKKSTESLLDQDNPDQIFNDGSRTQACYDDMVSARGRLNRGADVLTAAAAALDIGGSYGVWAKPGGLGSGTYGPRFEIVQAADDIAGILTDCAWTMRALGQHLVLAAETYQESEAYVHGSLKAHAKELDKEWKDLHAPPPAPAHPPYMRRPGVPI